MGIAGHILGDRKLRQLNREFPGYDFDRAYRYHGPTYARMIDERGDCVHFECDHVTGEVRMIEFPTHWTSCPLRSKRGVR
jgi:hypothetical protein